MLADVKQPTESTLALHRASQAVISDEPMATTPVRQI